MVANWCGMRAKVTNMQVFRKIFGDLSKAEAVAIAASECQARGWPWQEPVTVKRQLRMVIVRTNTDHRGNNASFVINARTKKIERAGFAVR